jgi:hypothetical protein
MVRRFLRSRERQAGHRSEFRLELSEVAFRTTNSALQGLMYWQHLIISVAPPSSQPRMAVIRCRMGAFSAKPFVNETVSLLA